jgi:hypothetical protein
MNNKFVISLLLATSINALHLSSTIKVADSGEGEGEGQSELVDDGGMDEDE